MPLFKRRDDEQRREEDEEEEEDLQEAEEDEEEEAEEEEDEEEPSIDDLLQDISTKPGEGPQPVEIDKEVEGLAGEDVRIMKVAKKVVVIGDPAVGKTSLIKRYVQDDFDDSYLNTIGAKVMKKNLGFPHPKTGEIVDLKLILWDIAGQETFEQVKKAYYRGAAGAIVVCDCTRKDTMENMHRWIENLFDVGGVVPLVLILNKVDLEEESQVGIEAVQDEYTPYEAPVYSTSAKTGHNVELIFHELGKSVINDGG
jgi:small GTP-binding protein